MPPSIPPEEMPFADPYEADEPQIPLLLADDDPLIRRVLANALTAGGYAVTCAEDGLEALELAQRGRFVVVVADMEMPRLDGLELATALAEFDPYLECILLASPEHLSRVVEAVEVGNVFNHFWKPLEDLGDLMRCIARALERRELRLSNARFFSELRAEREELRALRSRLEQLDKVAGLGQMVTSIAHDLDAPLKSLLGYAQYLRTRLLREDGEPLTTEQIDRIVEYLREMEQGVRNCHETVQDIKEYTRQHEEPPGPTDVHEVLDGALALMRHSMETQGIEIVLNLMPSAPPALANPRRFQQVMLNVLLNAQQAIGKAGGTVTVTTERARDKQGRETGVRIRIADTGQGIAPNLLPHIFDPFFTTRPRSESLGLGLTIARNIVHAWRGAIQVDSAPKKGTVVHVMLPLCAEMVVPLETPRAGWVFDLGGPDADNAQQAA